MPGAGHRYSVGDVSPGSVRRRRSRVVAPVLATTVLAALLILLLGPSGTVPVATAAGLTPCSAAPAGPIVTLDGEATLDSGAAGRRTLRRAGVRRTPVRPANALTGRPVFPVKKVRFGTSPKVWLKGGLRFTRGKRRAVARNLSVTVPRQRRRPARVTARLGRRTVVLFRLNGERRVIREAQGQIDLIGADTRLSPAAAGLINRRLGLNRAPVRKRLRAEVRSDRFDLSATWFVSTPDDPVADTPDEPPIAIQPGGAVPVEGAPPGQVSIEWELRESWIDYVNTGGVPKPGGGATPGAPRPPKNLIYSFDFPFGSGWTVPGAGAGGGISTLIKGVGSLAFRYCEHTINFKASDPEIELGDDTNSRMIFRVDGTDGTAFPDQRVVMVQLRPSGGTRTVTQASNGVTTVTWDRVPGFIPAEGTGIFANFYPPGDPFGFLTLTYTFSPSPGSST